MIVVRRWLTLVECGGLRVIAVVRPFNPGDFVELFSPPRGGNIVGATAGVPGITNDAGMTGVEGPIGDPERVAIENDMEKPEEFDRSNAAERKRKKLQISKEKPHVRTNQGERKFKCPSDVCKRTIWRLPRQGRPICAHFHCRRCYCH